MNRKKIPLSSDISFIPEHSCLVLSGGDEIHLTPNECRLLELIMNGTGRKELIINEIWLNRGTVVGESSYHQLIKMLRRKLQQAGLPYTAIKTIPRFGIKLMSFKADDNACAPPVRDEAQAPLPAEEVCREQVGKSSPISQDDVAFIVQDNKKKCVSAEDTVSIDGLKKTHSHFTNKKKFVFVIMSLVSLFMLACGWNFWSQPNPFPYQLQIDNTTFHLTSLGTQDRQALKLQSKKIGNKISHVYIASNGPRIWVATCENEITKDKKCHYENYSSY